jgi:hypothetical protein
MQLQTDVSVAVPASIIRDGDESRHSKKRFIVIPYLQVDISLHSASTKVSNITSNTITILIGNCYVPLTVTLKNFTTGQHEFMSFL